MSENSEFEQTVLKELLEIKSSFAETAAVLQTKMNLLISDDGSTGKVPAIEERVNKLEKKTTYYTGMFAGAGFILGAGIKHLLSKLGINL